MNGISMKLILTIIALAAFFFWSEYKGPACYQVSDGSWKIGLLIHLYPVDGVKVSIKI